MIYTKILSHKQGQVASLTHKNKVVSGATRKKQSLAHIGKTNSTKGSIYINKEGVVKRVDKVVVNEFCRLGWVLGRGPHSWSTKKKGQ